MRTTIDLPDLLLKHLKARAALEGRTLRDLVVELVEKGLNAREAIDPQQRFLARPLFGSGAPSDMPLHQLSNAQLHALAYKDEDERARQFMEGR